VHCCVDRDARPRQHRCAPRAGESMLADQAELAAVLRCPRCRRASLSLQRAGWVCVGCNAGYPVLGDVPWLFAEPQSMLAQWRARFQYLLLSVEREVRTLRAELAGDLGVLTRQRLELLAAAHEDHARRLSGLLAPLDLAATHTGYETHLALRTRLPSDQGLTNYYVNLHRDWSWGSSENDASLALIRSTTGLDAHWGRTLVLGAGSGRLAYDIHMQCAPLLTIAVDFNPLLLFIAREVTRGVGVELYEFPIAPRRLADHVVLRKLSAPQPARAGFHIVAADALRAPFATEMFDTVVTPWLIDIVSEDFASFAARVNALVRPGGFWVNFGSLAFSQGERAQRSSFEETVEIVTRVGFAQPALAEQSIPYMCSPASRHARLETVVAWCARKEGAAPTEPMEGTLPEWLIMSDRPVPQLEEFKVQAVATRIHAFLMALIDGRRSIRDMARIIVEQRLMSAEDAEPAVRRFLIRMNEDSRRGGV
jgi:SAM-dependent methyltransferase